uniref:glutathione transferase n=1 Tax=Aegilops tauschii TaxID=37682 RepID=R7W6N8_AEGTA
MAPVKVFGPAAFANVARVLVCLEEVGADYEVVDIDFMALEHKSPEHLTRNPFGQIPAFQDGDLILFESRAISKYVIHKYKMNEANLMREGIPTNQKVVDESLEKLKKVLEIYEEHLSKHKYLAGDFISFADLNHFPYTFYFMATPHAVLFDSYPHVKAWWESLVARPSIKKLGASMAALTT